MVPEAQQYFLRGVLSVGLVRQQRPRIAVNLIAMPSAQGSEFNLSNHDVTEYNASRGRIVTRK
jgi:hypothetical protein